MDPKSSVPKGQLRPIMDSTDIGVPGRHKTVNEELTYYSKAEIIKMFEGKGQIDIPTREELKKPKREKKVPRLILPMKVAIKPSRTYLTNLNPRIAKADKLWKNLYGNERGDLLKAMGIKDHDEITKLVQSRKTPDVVIDYFIINKNQPKDFHREIGMVLVSEKVKPRNEIPEFKGYKDPAVPIEDELEGTIQERSIVNYLKEAVKANASNEGSIIADKKTSTQEVAIIG